MIQNPRPEGQDRRALSGGRRVHPPPGESLDGGKGGKGREDNEDRQARRHGEERWQWVVRDRSQTAVVVEGAEGAGGACELFASCHAAALGQITGVRQKPIDMENRFGIRKPAGALAAGQNE